LQTVIGLVGQVCRLCEGHRVKLKVTGTKNPCCRDIKFDRQ